MFEDWASTIVETETGSNFPVPSIDDTSNEASMVGESVQGTEVTVANFSQKQIGAYKFHTGIIALSYELEIDGAFPWGAVPEKLFSVRMARGVGKKLITGNGTNEPEGLRTAVIASGAVLVIANGSSVNTGGAETGATSLGSPDFVNCLHNLDKAYRANAIWAMTDGTLSAIENIVTKMGVPIVRWRKGLTGEEEYPTILGRRVALCPSMDEISASSTPVILYAPEYWITRRVPSSLYLQRFAEAPGLVENGLVGVQLYGRYSSALVAVQNTARVPASLITCHS